MTFPPDDLDRRASLRAPTLAAVLAGCLLFWGVLTLELVQR